jgi:hypothetical protein
MNQTLKLAAVAGLLLMAAQTGSLAMAQEHDRARAEPRAEARGPAPQRGAQRSFDGRGQVLDSRYNHGRYYPPVGTVRPFLPEGYRPYYRGGSRF